MSNLKVAVCGLGNLGRYAIESIKSCTDMSCVGVIRRKGFKPASSNILQGVKEYSSLSELISSGVKPDVALLCIPSRNTLETAKVYLEEGINTVDSFDIHHEIPSTVQALADIAIKNNKAAVVAAGWDPGTDSILRAMLEAMAPVGTTFTNFGTGRSMGHSVAARNIRGVEDAISLTIPIGGGKHSRLVYVVLKEGVALEDVKRDLASDSYFAKDPLTVVEIEADRLSLVADSSHGVLMERTGGYGSVSNQRFSFDMRINNPALTSQVMVSSARAACRLAPGSYTLIDVPPVMLLPGSREDNIKRLV